MTVFLPVLAAACMLVAAITDIRSRRIPNLICLAIAILACARMIVEITGPGDLSFAVTGMVLDLAVGCGVLIVTAVLFGLGVIGGGDAKLFTAGTLFVGAARSVDFFFAVAVFGLILALLFMVSKMTVRMDGEVVAAFEKLPYGVAIAAGCVYVLAAGV